MLVFTGNLLAADFNAFKLKSKSSIDRPDTSHII